MRFLAQRIKTQIVSDATHSFVLLREFNQRGTLAHIHGERLLAHDVLARVQGGLGLLEVDMIWRADVDHVDGRVLYQIIEGFITTIQAEFASCLRASIRRTAQQSFYLDTQPPERFQMRSSHKPQTNDRRS